MCWYWSFSVYSPKFYWQYPVDVARVEFQDINQHETPSQRLIIPPSTHNRDSFLSMCPSSSSPPFFVVDILGSSVLDLRCFAATLCTKLFMNYEPIEITRLRLGGDQVPDSCIIIYSLVWTMVEINLVAIDGNREHRHRCIGPMLLAQSSLSWFREFGIYSNYIGGFSM